MEFLLNQPLLYRVNHYSGCDFGDQNYFLINMHVDKIALSSVMGTGHIHTYIPCKYQTIMLQFEVTPQSSSSSTLRESKEF